MRTAYKVRAYPDSGQAALLARTFGCVRLVWNRTLAERQRRHTTERRDTSYRETDANLTAWKKTAELAFLNEVSSVPLQQTLRHQHNAVQAFFAGRTRYPRFKSCRGRQSAHYTRSAFRLKPDGLWLAKTTAPLRVAWSWPEIDPVMLDPTMVVVSREPDGRWFVTFLVDTPDPAPAPPTGETVGIDLGVTDFAVLSTGERIPNPRHLVKRERGLRRQQRRLACCRPGSTNRAKAKHKLARLHARVRDARRDFLHQTSTALVRRFNRIGIEDLGVGNMVRNRSLARAISDTGWAEFRSMLEYKAQRAGRQVVVVSRWYPSSKTCSACGHLLAALALGTRQWTCPGCGTRHDRDLNAAQNIDTAAGLVVAASGGVVRPDQATGGRAPVKEESPQVTAGIPRLQARGGSQRCGTSSGIA
ncbi:RNA-guided endonuclease InsQ/TnpB family protein [Pseudonocardia asaccharolytica]|uniref:Transposase n=1 Tax=Pseudonocardia asaccharolytica DSM 44247 = NBRC 16224 TaxID=1123024 RepID=A0A511D1B3_9PSEU|nr:RNA-guided endonuclease TnpB family protein [Pseudonocardia asaccharolytica]GEL18323.1 transposase [Pseudonocardia asaccharolytica DSM 44247 = NBRC 16224]